MSPVFMENHNMRDLILLILYKSNHGSELPPPNGRWWNCRCSTQLFPYTRESVGELISHKTHTHTHTHNSVIVRPHPRPTKQEYLIYFL